MKLAVKITMSLLVMVACVYYAARGVDARQVLAELAHLPVLGVVVYLGSLALTHLFRAWRWEYLLRPAGTSVPFGRLLAISSVGFMAILALPVRLGEFVRPYYVARDRRMRMSAALGTVAVERIIDGLVISIVFFVSYLVSAGDRFSRELRFAAWLSLLGFLALTSFLAFALWRPEATIRIALRASLVQIVFPARAERIADKLRSLISGFRVLTDARNLTVFLAQTVAYWGFNGLGMWILARQMGLDISLGAAMATMSFTGVVLSLPNAPGLVGQFHAAIKLSLMSYLPAPLVNSKGIAYSVVLHGLQTVWYVALGLVSLAMLTHQGAATLSEAVRESKRAVESDGEVEPL